MILRIKPAGKGELFADVILIETEDGCLEWVFHDDERESRNWDEIETAWLMVGSTWMKLTPTQREN